MRKRKDGILEYIISRKLEEIFRKKDLVKNIKDFSKLMAKGKTSAVKDLERIIKKGEFKDTGTPTWMTDKNSYDIGIGDELNI